MAGFGRTSERPIVLAVRALPTRFGGAAIPEQLVPYDLPRHAVRNALAATWRTPMAKPIDTDISPSTSPTQKP